MKTINTSYIELNAREVEALDRADLNVITKALEAYAKKINKKVLKVLDTKNKKH
jgi:hypothetical protein